MIDDRSPASDSPLSTLERDLRAGCPVEEVEVTVGGRTLRLLRPVDIDGLIHRAREEDELPFWAYLWPASVGLARRLLDGERPVPAGAVAPRALELGAGLGLAGMAAALLGWKVIQTDLVPHALRFARVNALRNGMAIPGFVGDWRRFGARGSFDRILASDTLYEPKLHPALTALFLGHLAPGGRVLVADPCRVYALQFMARLEDRGWRVRVSDAPAHAEDDTHVVIYEASPGKTDEATRSA